MTKKALIPILFLRTLRISNTWFIFRLNIKWICQGEKIEGFMNNIKTHKDVGHQKEEKSCLLMYFITESGDYYKSLFYYQPYFYIIVKESIIK